jgi:hypothetical protein
MCENCELWNDCQTLNQECLKGFELEEFDELEIVVEVME